MGMMDLFTDYFAEDELGIESFLLSQGDLFDDFEIFTSIRYIPDPSVVFFWNDEGMARGHRVNA